VFGYADAQVAATWHIAPDGTTTLERTYVTDPSGSPLLRTTASGDASYPVLDALGSVVGTLDGSGQMSTTTAYGVFGDPHPSSSTGQIGLDGVYGYTGHTWDPDAGQYYANARWYAPDLGRFTSEDPIPATNQYSYADNKPMDYTDPTGEAPFAGKVGACILMAMMWFNPITGSDVLKPFTDSIEACAEDRMKTEELRLAEDDIKQVAAKQELRGVQIAVQTGIDEEGGEATLG
jgi:RHS repeat-associated protein